MMQGRGAYTAERAAALAGVPRSTVHYWARTGVLEPSVSPERVKLWSYTDLVALRFIYWLRQPKRRNDLAIPATSMPAVRRALAALREMDLDVWSASEGTPRLVVDRGGNVLLLHESGMQESSGQLVAEVLSLIEPFTAAEGIRGPDLGRPRPHLRIVPGKLSGAPHIAGTRIETEALAALEERNYDVARLQRLYPVVEADEIDEALDLEHQLTRNLRAAA